MQSATGKSGLLRQGVESAVYLALAVILFRGFAVEGYMISTGSMAPALLGYHRQVVCPSCSFAFSRGTRFDEEAAILAAAGRGRGSRGSAPAPAACPNCGQDRIDASVVPRNEGDQLLVHKHFYQLRPPHRWEVVVFRHPRDPAQAYVKRVAGLPDESIDIIDGDVYADGVLQRKPMATQRSMRICVYDHDHPPADSDWQPRWQAAEDGPWSPFGKGFVHRGDNQAAQLHWLTYHHWIRSGGTHRTSVELEHWPADLPEPTALDHRLTYDAAGQRLEYQGVLPPDVARQLQRLSADVDWQDAIANLQQRSHEAPIVDRYGYNAPDSSEPSPIHDLMLEAVVPRLRGEGDWRIQMTDGWRTFEAVFDIGRRRIELLVDGADQPVREAALPSGAFNGVSNVEMSLFDRQVLVAIDGELCFAPLPLAAEETPRELTTTPVRIGARNLDLQLGHVRLYRDIYYTSKPAPGREGPARLGPDEFFMLGDNSPVSLDSRGWESPAIPRRLLIGKPFLVHLPSRQGRLEFAGRVHHFRIPDFTRVRYIR